MRRKRKPRLNSNTSSIMPYRYVKIKIESCKEIGKKDSMNKYEITYTFDVNDYYHDVYGDFKFSFIAYYTSKPYKVGRTYRVPMTID